MRILLVQSQSVTKREKAVFPLGILYVATALLNHHHEVRVYDTNAASDPGNGIIKIIHEFKPDVIGVGLRNIDTATKGDYHSFVTPFENLIRSLKDASPGSPIVAGGTGFSLYARRLIERSPGIDYGVFNEAEESFPELLDNIDKPELVKGVFYRDKESVHFSGMREPINFAGLPTPRWDLVDLGFYRNNPFSIGIQTKRGCPFKCVYCTSPYLQGFELRMRSPGSVVDELEGLAKNYGLKDFFFVDSVFNAPKDYASEILQIMIDRGLNLKWHSFSNLRNFDAGYLKLALNAGCDYFEFSPDGISRSTLTALNKDYTRADIKRVASIAEKKKNVSFLFFFAVNGPGESLVNLFFLALFFFRMLFVVRRKDIYCVPYFLRIYPHTQIHSISLRKGMVKEGDDLIEGRFYDPPPLKHILHVANLTVKFLFSVTRAIIRNISKLSAYLGLKPEVT